MSLNLADYDYHLPPDRVAQYPLPQRDQSKMLVVDRHTGCFHHHTFADLPSLLTSQDLIVRNNTKVLPCRLHCQRRGHTGKIELLFLQPVLPQSPFVWNVLMRPARKLPEGTVLSHPNAPELQLTVTERGEMGKGVVSFTPSDHFPTVESVLMALGEMPIPPYLGRAATQADTETYQTVFASVPGSQAAPTAGLHFTPQVLQALSDKGVQQAEVTLTVSTGTFREVTAETITEHVMDAEQYHLPAETVTKINTTKAQGGRVLAVGTTTTKTLETVAHRHKGKLMEETGASELFIYPGFRFGVVDMLLTNFHLPKSTLMMLVSAFAERELILRAYAKAIAKNYRFYSYGDCMLIV